MVALLGVSALALDTSFMFAKRNQLHAAADAAAKSGAIEVCGVFVGDDLFGTNPNAEITGSPLPPVGVSDTCSGYCSGMRPMTLGAGAIYMPGTDVDLANHLTFVAGNCTLFIAKSLKVRNGNGAISNANCGSIFGGAAFLTASIAQ